MKIHTLNTQSEDYFGSFHSACSGGYREGETPGPIPNPEAKTLIAHNTASFRCGNVGRRLAVEFFNSYLITLNNYCHKITLSALLLYTSFMNTTLYFLRSSEKKIVTDMVRYTQRLDTLNSSLDDYSLLLSMKSFTALQAKIWVYMLLWIIRSSERLGYAV